MPTAFDQLSTELVVLVRKLRELHAGMSSTPGGSLELPVQAILKTVAEDGPVRLSSLADALCVDVSTVSRQVPVLVDRGWLAREADPADRRASLLRLTAEGSRVLEDYRAKRGELMRRLLPGWSEHDAAALAATLGRLNADVAASAPAVLARPGSRGPLTSVPASPTTSCPGSAPASVPCSLPAPVPALEAS